MFPVLLSAQNRVDMQTSEPLIKATSCVTHTKYWSWTCLPTLAGGFIDYGRQLNLSVLSFLHS